MCCVEDVGLQCCVRVTDSCALCLFGLWWVVADLWCYSCVGAVALCCLCVLHYVVCHVVFEIVAALVGSHCVVAFQRCCDWSWLSLVCYGLPYVLHCVWLWRCVCCHVVSWWLPLCAEVGCHCIGGPVLNVVVVVVCVVCGILPAVVACFFVLVC